MMNPSRAGRQRFIWLGLCAAVLIAGGIVLYKHLTRPVPQAVKLLDGTEAFFMSDSEVTAAAGYPTPRQIDINGDIFFRTSDAPQPMTVRSRLLILTVTGPTEFRITAWAHETGEQVEVLSGHIVARKSYQSTYMEPDTLTAGEMVMINRTIDLMEKEKFEPAAVRLWSETLISSAQRLQSTVHPQNRKGL